MEKFKFLPIEKCKTCDVDMGDYIHTDLDLFLSWVTGSDKINSVFDFYDIVRNANFPTIDLIPISIKTPLGLDRLQDTMESRTEGI